jgi:hypothetical protein
MGCVIDKADMAIARVHVLAKHGSNACVCPEG